MFKVDTLIELSLFLSVFFFQLALDIWKRKMIEPLKETLIKHVLIEVKRLVIVLGNGGFV